MMGYKPSKRLSKDLVRALMVALFLVGSAGVAGAQQSSDGEKAKAYYDQGVSAFFNKNYSQAITYFQRANALDPDPVVLYNISLAHSKLGNAEDALVASLKAAEMGGLPEDTALKNTARIRGYERIIRARSAADARSAQAAQHKELKSPGAGAPDSASDSAVGALGWVGVGTAGAGAAALFGSGVVSLLLRADIDDYEHFRTSGEYERARAMQDKIDERQFYGKLMLYSGVGLVALGTTLWAVDYFGNAETQTTAMPALGGALGPDGAHVQARWRF